MDFTLYYRGTLKANAGPQHKHELRAAFHKQLQYLWMQQPLIHFRDRLLSREGEIGVARPASAASRAPVAPPPGGDRLNVLSDVGGFTFASLVSTKVALLAELEVTLLWRHEYGHIVTRGGDIDNRIKTVLDALKVPTHREELPRGFAPRPDQVPFFCLLEDDSLITRLSVTSTQLLDTDAREQEAVLLIRVLTKQARVMMGTIGLS